MKLSRARRPKTKIGPISLFMILIFPGFFSLSYAQEEDAGRSFFFKEAVFSGFYSPDGVASIPADDRTRDHFELSPRAPGNYLGFEFVKTFTSSSSINRKVLPDWLPLTAMNLHPRLVFDALESSDGFEQVDFAPQDFWMRFNPGGVDRLSLRVGQFVIPYGVNPILAPRQQFILPIESLDLGLKWDWGISLKGPISDYEWEIASTIGSGEALHDTHPFQGPDRKSFLVSGRIGAPTYWNFQYGLSFLAGELPTLQGSRLVDDTAISRWRIGLDSFYKYGTYLMLGSQATFGQDGFGGDNEFVGISGGDTANVLGYRAWVDWVIPQFTDLRLGGQFESVIRDLSTSRSDDTALIFEVGYSLTTSLTMKLDYRAELNRSFGKESDAIFLTLIYYAR